MERTKEKHEEEETARIREETAAQEAAAELERAEQVREREADRTRAKVAAAEKKREDKAEFEARVANKREAKKARSLARRRVGAEWWMGGARRWASGWW